MYSIALSLCLAVDFGYGALLYFYHKWASASEVPFSNEGDRFYILFFITFFR